MGFFKYKETKIKTLDKLRNSPPPPSVGRVSGFCSVSPSHPGPPSSMVTPGVKCAWWEGHEQAGRVQVAPGRGGSSWPMATEKLAGDKGPLCSSTARCSSVIAGHRAQGWPHSPSLGYRRGDQLKSNLEEEAQSQKCNGAPKGGRVGAACTANPPDLEDNWDTAAGSAAFVQGWRGGGRRGMPLLLAL